MKDAWPDTIMLQSVKYFQTQTTEIPGNILLVCTLSPDFASDHPVLKICNFRWWEYLFTLSFYNDSQLRPLLSEKDSLKFGTPLRLLESEYYGTAKL